eukprot:CAMPEP_0173179998 /NCGR_PEP_ID=MMETSP1141-20130122/6454_1 /TAXON_ID=483371 /ORGANISM="non described non described, Strain CCMP2298" /LENGTH=76 /DNA_ID=CAMNT_0014102765 /DNA_START=340 /DNA_END=571 /DNA_ORIENTATION=+
MGTTAPTNPAPTPTPAPAPAPGAAAPVLTLAPAEVVESPPEGGDRECGVGRALPAADEQRTGGGEVAAQGTRIATQ